MEPKTFSYESGTVTVHGWERWPANRLAPILTEYISKAAEEKEKKNAA